MYVWVDSCRRPFSFVNSKEKKKKPRHMYICFGENRGRRRVVGKMGCIGGGGKKVVVYKAGGEVGRRKKWLTRRGCGNSGCVGDGEGS